MELSKITNYAEQMCKIFLKEFEEHGAVDEEWEDLENLEYDFQYANGKIQGTITSLQIIANLENEASVELKYAMDTIDTIYENAYNKLVSKYSEIKVKIERRKD